MNKLLKTTAISLLMSSNAYAGDLIIGVGASDILDDGSAESATVIVEYHADPFFERGRLSTGLGVAGQVDDDGDVFLGFGLATIIDLSKGLFIETSLMPGYYGPSSDGTDLGGNLQFRTVLGIGYKFNADSSISLAVDHKSNASIEDTNPGNETIMIRYRKRF